MEGCEFCNECPIAAIIEFSLGVGEKFSCDSYEKCLKEHESESKKDN